MAAAAEEAKTPVQISRVGTMFGMFFADQPVIDWPTAKRADTQRFARFFQAMLARGVYLAPSQFEAGFLSSAHGEREIDQTLAAAGEAFAGLASS